MRRGRRVHRVQMGAPSLLLFTHEGGRKETAAPSCTQRDPKASGTKSPPPTKPGPPGLSLESMARAMRDFAKPPKRAVPYIRKLPRRSL